MAERTLPGCILVSGDGRRFVNEAAPPGDVVRAMLGQAQEPTAWLIFDQRYRDRYPFATFAPREPFPSRWYREGIVHRSASLAGLAANCCLPPEALQATVDRFNGFAAIGLDHDFRRGESRYDGYFGDPRNHPGPCLGELVKAPFYAVRVVPGDLGTKGGLVSDERARVLREDGTAIRGLYAAGNTSALLLGRAQAGPGSTIGPAMTFGYIAALQIARQAQAAASGQQDQAGVSRPQ
jgi:3-oxosteroid 1-dehydrogenase